MVNSKLYFVLVCVVIYQVISQNTITAQNLKCYHCDVNGLKSTEIRQKCLQDKGDFGELKQCPLSDHICAKGELEFEGKPVAFRRCQMAKGKAGTCEENEVMGSKARICYCNTDSCNSSRNLYASVVTLLSSIASVLMIHVFTQLCYS